jgi:dephospho-CoA kinase
MFAHKQRNMPNSRLAKISPHQQPPLQEEEEEEEVQAKQKKHVHFIQIPTLFARKQQRKHTNFETSCNFSTPTTSMTRRRRRRSTSKAKKACRLHPDSNIFCTQAAKKTYQFRGFL